MNEKIIKRFCLSMLVLQLIFFNFPESYPSAFLINFTIVVLSVLGGFGAILGIILTVNNKLERAPFVVEKLCIFLACIVSVVFIEVLYGFENINLAVGNDYSTDITNPPQYQTNKYERLDLKQHGSILLFMDDPEKVLKAGTDSLVLAMSGRDSKLLVKRAINKLGWMFVGRSDDASTDKVFNETYRVLASQRYTTLRSDLVVRIISSSKDYSLVDIRSSMPDMRRDLGFNELMIGELSIKIREQAAS